MTLEAVETRPTFVRLTDHDCSCHGAGCKRCTKFIRIGVKVAFNDGTTVSHCWKSDTFTVTIPGIECREFFWSDPVKKPDTVHKGLSRTAFCREFGHRFVLETLCAAHA